MPGGHNHRSWCDCPWCHHRRRRLPKAAPLDFRTVTFDSFTIPNASCPVCAASVFFYQSPHGGRVFFDSLGPPWPKHHCTDDGGRVSRPMRFVRNSNKWRLAKAQPRTAWQSQGWEPFMIDSVAPHSIPSTVRITGKLLRDCVLRLFILSAAVQEVTGVPIQIRAKPGKRRVYMFSMPGKQFEALEINEKTSTTVDSPSSDLPEWMEAFSLFFPQRSSSSKTGNKR